MVKEFYRGETKHFSKISPKIARENPGIYPYKSLSKLSRENNFNLEFDLINQYKEIPFINESLKNLNYTLDSTEGRLYFLAKLQHYGFPTRLIDITREKDVARYFASKLDENFNQNGRIITFEVDNNKYLLSKETTKIRRMLDLVFDYNSLLKEKMKFTGLKLAAFKRSLGTPVFIDELLVNILEKSDNLRIKAQDGAFIMMNNKVLHYGNDGYELTPQISDELPPLWIKIENIPFKEKLCNLVKLMIKGICFVTLFPDDDRSIKIEKEIAEITQEIAVLINNLHNRHDSVTLEQIVMDSAIAYLQIPGKNKYVDEIEYNKRIELLFNKIRQHNEYSLLIKFMKFIKGDLEPYIKENKSKNINSNILDSFNNCIGEII